MPGIPNIPFSVPDKMRYKAGTCLHKLAKISTALHRSTDLHISLLDLVQIS